MKELVIGMLAGAGSVGAGVLALAEGAVDGGVPTIVGGGVLGTVAAWLLWRNRELERETRAALKEKDETGRAEREQAWKGVEKLRESVDEQTKVLVEIRTHLEQHR